MSATFQVQLAGQTVPLQFQTISWGGLRSIAEADLTADVNSRAAKAANGSDFADKEEVTQNLLFLQAGTGAVSRSLRARLRDTVSAFDFIPTAEHAAIRAGTSTYDASDDIQAAIDTGLPVELPAGTYNAAGLTISTNRQQLIALGVVRIVKNANGPILSSNADEIELNGISFRGDASTPTFTGDNISLTGASPRLINCGSRWAHGLALKSTGNRTQIIGTCDIYQTASADSGAHDIEIGVSGTVTLYHEVWGYYSSQATGGIKFIDCGSQTVVGGEFGKLTIASGTSPAGVNGGKCMGARILGDVTVGLANGVFIGNQFGAVTFTIGAGVSGTHYEGNSEQSGFSLVNSGPVNQGILRHKSDGVGGYITYQFGASSSVAVHRVDPVAGDHYFDNGHIHLTASKAVYFGSTNKRAVSSSGNLAIANDDGSTQFVAAGDVQFLPVGKSIFYTNGVQKFAINADGRPQFDGGTQTTVGSAGAASALPANPTGYIVVNVGGTEFVVPYYAKS